MAALNLAGFVFQAASLALQLGEVGKKIIDSNRTGHSPYSDIEGLEIAISHECEQTKLLSAIIVKEKFGLTRNVIEETGVNDQEVMLAIFGQLFRIWSEVTEIRNKQQVPDQIQASPFVGARALEEGAAKEAAKYLIAADVDRLKELLRTAAEWNDRLERRLRALAWICSMSISAPEGSISRLNNIARDTEAHQLGWTTPALLRQLVLAVANPQIDRTMLPIPPSLRLPNDCISGVNNLSEGVVIGLNKVDRKRVLVEFLSYERFSIRSDEDAIMKRVEQLTALLFLPKDSAFCLPAAIGFYNDSQRARYGIVFAVSKLDETQISPHGKMATLNSLLQKISQRGAHRPSLGNRLKLASRLALSLSKIQSIGWVHQGIRSENILFSMPQEIAADSKTKSIQFERPWWIGYSSSRSDNVPSVQLYDENLIRNLHRHPNRWGHRPMERFNKLHDIYSLGVVLLEIGYCAPISSLVRQELTKGSPSPSAVVDDLMSLSRHHRLADLMGERYVLIVQLCLESSAVKFGVPEGQDNKDDSLLQAAFFDKVVKVLENAAEAVAGSTT